VVSRGREFVKLVLENPEIGYQLQARDKKEIAKLIERFPSLKHIKWNWSEKFSYCVPHESDVKLVDENHYINKMTEYLEDTERDYYGNGELTVEEGFSVDMANNKIKELKEEIAKIESLKPDIKLIHKMASLVCNGHLQEAFKFAEDNEDKIREAYKLLNNYDLIHYGIGNLMHDLGRSLYGKKLKLY
ncbi:hypothetical protein N9948_02020, partial [bacterium]|nr:hypothetical protein [bacterium]